MKFYIGLTDFKWFSFLRSQPDIDEINFWQPGGTQRFKALEPAEVFLFKLHYPHNKIVGGGFFAYSTILPMSLAWDSFGIKNGAESFLDMRQAIGTYRKDNQTEIDYQIGCILLEQPFFWDEKDWLDPPADWKPNIVQGKTYDISSEIGRKLWDDIQFHLRVPRAMGDSQLVAEPAQRYGAPVTVLPRLGQGSFRVIVTDVYNRRCCVTRERTLPALEAAHIKPYTESGPHSINNGLLLRSDLHKLLDKGYVTISLDYHFEVSRKIKEEFENGRDYYALHGRKLNLPAQETHRPTEGYIKWHNEKRYLG